jgi:hypothetical protein
MNVIELWMNDLTWARVNTLIARKTARQKDLDTIHTACTMVTIPPGDKRRQLRPGQVLRQMGHYDLANLIEKENGNGKD